MKGVERIWYTSSVVSYLLWPLSIVFRSLVRLRRFLYQRGVLAQHKFAVPVIVVGNITVGGTGKTPMVAWLAKHLQSQGWRPGIVSRGYGGSSSEWPQVVTAESNPHEVGDEPVLLARHTGCPVVVAPKRVQAVQSLLDKFDCNVIISDDGLQHYALQRDVEIVIVDGARRFGNGFTLPAGPLREPLQRLDSIDYVVCNGDAQASEYAMTLKPLGLCNVNDSRQVEALGKLYGLTVHGVAGIGNPKRFFSQLSQLGAHVIEHPYPDHHPFQPGDFRFGDNHPVVMTEKDAVKCRDYDLADAWYLAIEAQLDPHFIAVIDKRMQELTNRVKSA